MPRTKRLIRRHGRSAAGDYEFVEVFTHRCDVGDRVIYADPTTHLWMVPGCSWLGAPPPDWDESKAEVLETPLRRIYEMEIDYS
jgi:hypothetical protein